MTNLEFSPSQQRALERWRQWSRTPSKELFIGGLAGTGKTTIISEIRRDSDTRVLAPTNRAARVLCDKDIPAGTCSSYVERLRDRTWDPDGRRVLNFEDKEDAWSPRIICDESPMLNQDQRKQVLAACEKVVWVGDYGQLQPVTGKPFFVEDSVDVFLEEIHRQDEDSQIIPFAHFLREGGKPGDWKEEPRDVTVLRGSHKDKRLPSVLMRQRMDIAIAWRNQTVQDLNRSIRRSLGYRHYEKGSKVCAYSNFRDEQVSNGDIFTVHESTGTHIKTKCGRRFRYTEDPMVQDLDEEIVLVKPGYAITAHKSQGSEWNNVFVYDCVGAMRNAHTWRYTASTRAQSKLLYIWE